MDAHDARAAGDLVARPVLAASARAALFLVAMPLLSLAILLPRIDALEASSLAAGYDQLEDAIGVLGDSDTGSIQANGVWAAWPLAFGATPRLRRRGDPARRSSRPARAPSSPPRPRVLVERSSSPGS